MKNLLLFLGLFLTFSLTTVSCGDAETKDEDKKEVSDETASCCKDGEKCDPAKCKKDGKCDPAKCKKEGKTCDHDGEGKCSEGKCADKCGEDHGEGSKC